MKITVRNLGIISQAEIDIKPLTILVGPNNAGKTWLAYLLGGFLGGPAQQTYVDKYADGELLEQEIFLDAIVNDILGSGIASLNMVEFVDKESERYLNLVGSLIPEWIAPFLGTARADFDQLGVSVALTGSKKEIQQRILKLALQGELGFGQDKNTALLTAKKPENILNRPLKIWRDFSYRARMLLSLKIRSPFISWIKGLRRISLERMVIFTGIRLAIFLRKLSGFIHNFWTIQRLPANAKSRGRVEEIGMPFNTLLLQGLMHGTSVEENGVHVIAHEQKGEKVLVFRLDTRDKSTAKALQLSGGICDYLFLLSKETLTANSAKTYQRTLCLVELKGEDIEHATKQIINTYKHLNTILKNDSSCFTFLKNITWKAYICSNRRAPIVTNRTCIDSLLKTFGQKKHFDLSHDGDKNFNSVLRA